MDFFVRACRRPRTAPANLFLLLALGAMFAPQAGAANGNVRVKATSTLSVTSGGLTVAPYAFGRGLAELGDFDADGIPDLVAAGDDSVLVLRMTADGSVKPGGVTSVPRAENSSYYNASVEFLGDLDGDGGGELAIGQPNETVAGLYSSGRLTIVFFHPDGTEKKRKVIDRTSGSLPFLPAQYDYFGASLARIGDLDGDGVPELAVGVPFRDSVDPDTGAVVILFFDAAAAIKDTQVLEGMGGTYFGASVAPIGDFDGDGVPDLAAGTPGGQGALDLLYLHADGTLKASHRIDGNGQDFSGYLGASDGFGESVAALGDVDGDGVLDVAVGTSNSDSAWLLLLNADGTVKLPNALTPASEGIPATEGHGFGSSIALLGDLDGNGGSELAIGAPGSATVWIFFRDAAGANLRHVELSRKSGGFGAYLSDLDRMGSALARLGDLDGDGLDEMLAGAPNVSDSAWSTGSVWILYPSGPSGVSQRRQLTGAFAHGMQGLLDPGDRFGAAVAATGDLDGDGVPDFAAGAPGDDDGGDDRGAVWIVLLTADGAVKGTHKLSSTAGGLSGPLADGAGFGSGVASVGDLDADGHGDLAVLGDDGTVRILFLDATFTVKSEALVDSATGSVAAVGDLDGDGRTELAIGRPDAAPRGAIEILFLNADASIRNSQRVDESQGGFVAVLEPGSRFGRTVSTVGDLDEDGVADLAVGAATPGDGDFGALWLMFLAPDGAVGTARQLANGKGGFSWNAYAQSQFGAAVARTSDLDGDGREDLLIGNPLERASDYSSRVTGGLYLSTVGPICDSQPREFCLGGSGKLSLKRNPGRNPKNSLRWSLGGGDATPREAFGSGYSGWPDYALCLYDMRASVPAPAAAWFLSVNPSSYYYYSSYYRWVQTSTGARYDDRYEGSRDGIRQMILTAGEQGKTRMQVRATGGTMVLPAAVSADQWLDADPSVVVQLVNSTGACWSTPLGRVQSNSATMFKAQQ